MAPPRVFTPLVITLAGLLLIIIIIGLVALSGVAKKKKGIINPPVGLKTIQNANGDTMALVRTLDTNNFFPSVAAFSGQPGDSNTRWDIVQASGGLIIKSTYVGPTQALRVNSASDTSFEAFDISSADAYLELVPEIDATLFNIDQVEGGFTINMAEETEFFLATAPDPNTPPPQELTRLYVISRSESAPEVFMLTNF